MELHALGLEFMSKKKQYKIRLRTNNDRDVFENWIAGLPRHFTARLADSSSFMSMSDTVAQRTGCFLLLAGQEEMLKLKFDFFRSSSCDCYNSGCISH